MFTQKELNILRSACGNYKGCYDGHDFENLTSKEIERHKKSIKYARKLAKRFEELLYDIELKRQDLLVEIHRENRING